MELNLQIEDELRKIVNECLESFFKKNNQANGTYAIPGELVSTKEICEYLGITEPTLIRWKKKGKIPFIEIGNSIRFDKAMVIKALEKNSVK